jgi:FkbM family methyltransferase
MDFETKDFVFGRTYNLTVIKDDQYITPCLERGCEWDGWMRMELPDLIRPEQEILDIGGNIGWNALMFSDYAPVHTFEPFYYKIIQKNIEQNQTKYPITLHPYGLSNSEQISDFYIPKREGNLCNYGGSGVGFSENCEKSIQNIVLKPLDSVYSGAPCLMKIDVEGHELAVLQGAEQTIRTYLPNVYIETFESTDGPIFGFMNSLGYTTVYQRPECNYLFISPLQ